MNTVSVTYNFPTGFLWGITPQDEILSEASYSSYLFRLQEAGVKALRIEIKWARCEPLKGQFDEVYIESRRLLLARIKSRNIEPAVILDSRELPAWKNLDHRGDDSSEFTDAYSFYTHLAEVLSPYTNFFGIYCPPQTLFTRNRTGLFMEEYHRLAENIHSYSDRAKAGLILPEDFGTENRSWMKRLFAADEYRYLSTSEYDFLGLPANKHSVAKISEILGEKKVPLMFMSDGLNKVSPENRIGEISDMLYDIWQLYQKGIPVKGYFSEMDLRSGEVECELYENSCKSNALMLSTQMSFLPEKWIRFLKD